MFPFSISGSLKAMPQDNGYFIEQMQQSCEKELEREAALHLYKNAGRYVINGDVGRFTWKGFHFLNGVSKVVFWIEDKTDYVKVKFRLYFWETFVLALLFSIIPAFTSPNLILHYNNYDYNIQLWLIFFIWGIGYFGNILISFVRFLLFLSKRKKRILESERDYILDKKIKEVRELRNKLAV